MEAADRDLLTTTFAQALESSRGRNGDDVLTDLGWADLVTTAPRDAIEIVFGLLGRANVVSSCLSDVVAVMAGLPPGTDVVLPAYGSASAPGTLTGGRVEVAGLTLGTGGRANRTAIVCDTGRIAVVPAGALTRTNLPGIDPALGCATIAGSVEPSETGATADWTAVVDAARLAIAHELTGASRTMLDLACDHARGRVQFGRPIASFQAVRHKLAEVLVAIEAAESALAAASDTPASTTATLAKILAGRAAASAAANCQQVLAGIGFTREHDFHHFLRRTIALDGLFGSPAALTRELGAELIASGSVPRVVEL